MSYWLIRYEDASIPSDIFTDEVAARATYERRSERFNCTLFVEASSSVSAGAGQDCHICKRPRNGPGELWCSYPHSLAGQVLADTIERAALIADRADWLVTVVGPDAPHLELTRAERKAWAELVDALRSSRGGEGEKT